jgi:hypothetical protein
MKNRLLLYFLLFTFTTQAQQYSYVSDRKFNYSSDLLGYTFVPGFAVYPDKEDLENSSEVKIGSSEFSFGITQNYLYVTGSEVEGVYNITSINPTNYGFLISTMNARDSRIQGHLKITLDNISQVTGLIFKKSAKTKELVFKLGDVPESVEALENDYFTKIKNKAITTDIIWGNTYRPFFRIDDKQHRLQIADSVKIEVTVDTVRVQKKKKVKTQIKKAITISYQGFDKNGNRTDYEKTYPVESIKERESQEPGATFDKYQIELKVKNLPQKYIYFYLNDRRAVSKIELGENEFLIRGY